MWAGRTFRPELRTGKLSSTSRVGEATGGILSFTPQCGNVGGPRNDDSKGEGTFNFPRLCFNCGKLGHRAASCSLPLVDRRIRQCFRCYKSGHGWKKFGLGSEVMGGAMSVQQCVRNVDSLIPCYIEVVCWKGWHTQALVDTGSTYSIISESARQSMEANGVCLRSGNKVRASLVVANGQVVISDRSLKIRIGIGKLGWWHVFFVLPNLPVNMILGLDFLTKVRADLEFSSGKMTFPYAPGEQAQLRPVDNLKDQHSNLLVNTASASELLQQLTSEFPDRNLRLLGSGNSPASAS